MSVKGKEKEDESKHGPTLFVSNLLYSTTNASLEAAFSDIAPVRSAFVVTHKDTETGHSRSKGVGYVTFAIREDAESTVKRYGSTKGEQILIDGRKIGIQWANRKIVADEQSSEKPVLKAPQAPRIINRPHKSQDPNAIRTVVLTNVPLDVTKSVLWKKLRKQDGVQDVEWPARDQFGKETPGIAHALFNNAATAQTAISHLHAHVYKGAVISATLKKRIDSQAGLSRAGRLIVRNLPHDVTENDLHALFLPHGPIHSITLPQTKSDLHRPRFAFVWMLSKVDAESALNQLNGSIVRPGLAADVVSRAAFKKAKRKRKSKLQDVQENEGTDQDMEGSADEAGVIAVDTEVEVPLERSREGRIIAVDWALSKERWEQTKQVHVTDDQVDASMGDEDTDREGDERKDASSLHDDDEERSESFSIDGGSDIDNGEEDDEDIDVGGGKDVTHNPPPPEEGTTLFVRNLPFEASEEDLKSIFRPFGSLRYARITMDRDTGRSRGTGFVCFWKVVDANAVMAEAERLKAEAGIEGMTATKKKVNPFSLLTPDPSSSLAAKLVLMGRTLDVTMAVSRDEAGKLKDAGERSRERKDSRHLYLMREGVILPSNPAAQSLASADLERRVAAYEARKTLLRSNPSLYISLTRLSVRQLPTFVTERVLKRLGLHAVRAFQDEVRDGKREDLTPEEKAVAATPTEGQELPDQASKKSRKGERRTGVKQSKITRQADRVDPLVGKGRSRGYGFLEMEKHSDALMVLRWANNREGVTKLMWEWWRDELKDLVKKAGLNDDNQKNQDPKEPNEAQARLELWKRKLKSMEAESKGVKDRPLLIEFSIENVQVTKRRAAREVETRTGLVTGMKRSRSDDVDPRKMQEDVNSKPIKRHKGPETNDSLENPTRAEAGVGALIGKRRKEKKAKRASRG